jgi:uncharacterized membrane protein
MSASEQPSALVRLTLGLEGASVLDAPVRALEPGIRALFGSGPRGAALRGEWLGHTLHPVLTDLTLGLWTSASVLDVVGGAESAKAAQRLLGTGVLTFFPTAWSGWAEWSQIGTRDKRVGLVHAVTNGVAVSLYASSWLARRRGERGRGVRRALVGAAVGTVGGYLGGHLAQARQVGSHDPAYSA